MEKAVAKIACIQGKWHQDISNNTIESFKAKLKTFNYPIELSFFEVPGCLEFPLFAKKLALSKKFQVICGVGFVVNGGIYRHDFVASAIIDGIVAVSTETLVPILSAILTPHHFHEHEVHTKFFAEHMKTKGEELACACIDVINLNASIDKLLSSS